MLPVHAQLRYRTHAEHAGTHTCTRASDNWAATLACVARQMMHRPVDSFPPDSRSIRCTTPRFALHRMRSFVRQYRACVCAHPAGACRRTFTRMRAQTDTIKSGACQLAKTNCPHLASAYYRDTFRKRRFSICCPWVRAARAFPSLCTDTYIHMRFHDCFNVSSYWRCIN